MDFFFFLPVLQYCRSAWSFQLPCATYHYMNWAVLLCVCDLGQQSLSLTSDCSASVLFCPPQHPLGSLLLPLLACPPLPAWDLPLIVYVTMMLRVTQSILWAADISHWSVFSSRRMMKMRILPLECLTVMFSSKMATSEQRHGPSCQSVSTQFMLFPVWGFFSADSVPVDSPSISP